MLIAGAVPPSLAAADTRDTAPDAVTVKGLPLLACSPALTTTSPLKTPAGASTRISLPEGREAADLVQALNTGHA